MVKKLSIIKRKLNSNAINQPIGLILSAMIFFSAAGASLIVGTQYMNSEEDRQEHFATANQYAQVAEVLEDLIALGNETTLKTDFVINDGSIEIDSDGDKIILLYSNDPSYGFDVVLYPDHPEYFSIIMEDASKTIDNATIYHLSSTCFLSKTKIKMADGPIKNIQDIKRGDIVSSFDEKSGSFVDATVKALLTYKAELMDDYYLLINNHLRVTSNHIFLSKDTTIEAGELKIGDIVSNFLGQNIIIHSIEKVYSKEETYDLILESGNIYFANGLMVKSDVIQINIFDSEDMSRMSSTEQKQSPLGANKKVTTWHSYPRKYDEEATKDTHISGEFPDTNYGDKNYLEIDTQYIYHPIGEDEDLRERALVYFPFSEDDIAGYSKILQANVNLYYYARTTNEVAGRIHQIYECEWDWTEGDGTEGSGATWNTDEENYDDSSGPVATVSIPSGYNYGFLSWDVLDSIQEYVGDTYYDPGPPPISGDNPPEFYNYHGWYVRDSEAANYLITRWILYRSRNTMSGNERPYMYIEYINPPVIENEEATNIGNDTATLEAYLSDDGGDDTGTGTSCKIRYGYAYDELSQVTPTLTNRKDYGSLAEIDFDVVNLNSGDLVYYKGYAYNDAYHGGSADGYARFMTMPPAPDDFHVSNVWPNKVRLSWDAAEVDGEGQQVWYKILYKQGNSYPDGYFAELTDPEVETWEGQGTSTYIYNLEENEHYKFIIYTNVTETAYDGEQLWEHSEEEYPSRCYGNTNTNDPPNTPAAPTGPDERDAGQSGTYTGVTTDPDGNMLSYQFDWDASGAHDLSEWSSPVNSGQPSSMSHLWGSGGVYVVKVRAKDAYSYSSWSPGLSVTVNASTNNPPNKPSTPTGPAFLETNEIGTYSSSTTDPEDEQIQYMFDWDANGSHEYSSWSSLINSGQTINMNKDWSSSGEYTIKVRAKDSSGLPSDWSDGFEVNVSGAGKPTTPVIKTRHNNFYNGTNYTFYAYADDPDGDNLYYLFDFGDPDYTPDWQGPYHPSQPYNEIVAEHSWKNKGLYELKVKAKDTSGEESEWSEPMAIRVYYKYVIPPDRISSPVNSEFNANDPLPFSVATGPTFSSDKPFEGATLIYLFSNDYPNQGHEKDKGNVPFGVVCIIDPGAIVVRPRSSSSSKSIYQNGGIISVLSNGVNVNIYEKDDILAFPITMIRGDTVTSGSGSGTYTLSFRNMNTYMREQQEHRVYNIKVKFTGDYNSYWHDYLSRNTKFATQPGTFNDFLLYDSGSAKQLMFSTSLIKTNIE